MVISCLIHSGQAQECTGVPDGQGQEISVLCLVMNAEQQYYIFTFILHFKLLKNYKTMEMQKFVMLYQYGIFLFDVYYMKTVLVWCMACRVEYHNILVWHLEVDMEKVT
jgi:hypothetical protein